MPFKIGEIATGLTKIFKLPLTVGKKTATVNGWVQSFSYYPTRLSDAELQSLTADKPIVTYTPV